MSRKTGKGFLSALVSIVLLQPIFPTRAAAPPTAGCIDLNQLTGGWRTADRELVISAGDSASVSLTLDAACPVFAQEVDLQVQAAGQLACPGSPVVVTDGATTCPVTEMTALSPSTLADTLEEREEQLQADVTLKGVQVRAKRHWKDITGTTAYCVDSRFIRGWSSTPEGLTVTVAPRRHSGNKQYLIETVEACRPPLSPTAGLSLASRNGGAAICGYPGDKVRFSDAPFLSFHNPAVPNVARTIGVCEVKRVTPVARR